MPVIETRAEPSSASQLDADEADRRQEWYQKQYEEDVARIFDESLCPDIEVVCGKLKILTHTCILKARTKEFYLKLENLLHTNISRSTFDEIYSFISDVYTECNIHNQEKEIIAYLESSSSSNNTQVEQPISSIYREESDSSEEFATPKCTTPYSDKVTAKCVAISPSIDLTKEYYAIVPIEGNLLDKELKEQEALSNAFQSIIKTQSKELKKNGTAYVKPNSLSLRSSHTSKNVVHSNSCDVLKNYHIVNKVPVQTGTKNENKTSQNKRVIHTNAKSNYSSSIWKPQSEAFSERSVDPTYSPDSLMTDEPSSSSDYLSAAFCSPGMSSSACNFQSNAGDSMTTMDNILTSTDSGVENADSINATSSQKDVTLTDTSLTESTLHDLIADGVNSWDSGSPGENVNTLSQNYSENESKENVTKNKVIPNCKEEKQRQNEEIVILESSSLSSETGSWESVFPPKICESKAIPDSSNKAICSLTDEIGPSLVQKSPYRNAPCFIDASTLADEDKPILPVSETARTDAVCKTKGFNPTDQSIKAEDISSTEVCNSNNNVDLLSLCDLTNCESLPNPSIRGKEIKGPATCITESTTSTPFNSFMSNASEESKNPTNHQSEITPMLHGETSRIVDLQTDTTSGLEGYNNKFQKYYFESINAKVTKPTQQTKEEKHILLNSETKKPEASLKTKGISSNDSQSSKVADISPVDVSDSHDIEDSLEQSDIEDPDSLHKDNLQGSDHHSKKDPKIPSLSRGIEEVKGIVLVNDDGTKFLPLHIFMSNLKEELRDQSPLLMVGDKCHYIVPQKNTDFVNSDAHRRMQEDAITAVKANFTQEVREPNKNDTPQKSNASSWVVDMSMNAKSDDLLQKDNPSRCMRPKDRTCENLRNEIKHTDNHENGSKSRSSVDSDGSEKSSHKFYIDLATLPDPLPPKIENISESLNEKKNIFSMYIDLGEQTTLKEMPARLSSSLNSKKKLDISRIESSSEIKVPPKKIDTSKTKGNSNEPSQDAGILFEEYENLCNNSAISISDIISKATTAKHSEINVNLESVKEEKFEARTLSTNRKSRVVRENGNLSHNIEKNVPTISGSDVFVRLSDLDRPLNPNTIFEQHPYEARMTRSIPDSTWGGQTISGASRSIEIISSFHSENALSLNRLFPNLTRELSSSMPGSLSSRTRSSVRTGASSSNGDMEDSHGSDTSEMSSVQSSYHRSILEHGIDESLTQSILKHCSSKLGKDLLRMFLEEIAPDVVVEVSGRRIKAHKCILSSRCQYFAGILSGGWVESAGNVIILPPFSYNVVHFALCHIYSGISMIPDSISIVELATIADMLSLEGLREAIMYSLRTNYCHHFHIPCKVCILGVLECLPLTSAYGLDELYRRCLKWITEYFFAVWSTKEFATLPKELLEKCLQQHLTDMTVENLAETVSGCGLILAVLPSTRWAEITSALTNRLLREATHFSSLRLVQVIKAMSNVPLDTPKSGLNAIQECLQIAIDRAPPDQACRSYGYLMEFIRSQNDARADKVTISEPRNYLYGKNLLCVSARDWRNRCENTVVRFGPRAANCQRFNDLPPDLKERLRSLGCYGLGRSSMGSTSSIQETTRSPNRMRKLKPLRDSTPMGGNLTSKFDAVRLSFVPYAKNPPFKPPLTTLPPNVNKISSPRKMPTITAAAPPKIRTTKAQEERAKYNMTINNLNIDRATKGSRAQRFENTKPRYLEPKVMNKDANKATPLADKKKTQVRMLSKITSTSDSSRDSSPIQVRKRPPAKQREAATLKSAAMSQDSLATSSRPHTAEPSTESLTESQSSNKYATYTKSKHPKGSVESVNHSQVSSSRDSSMYKNTKIPVYINHARQGVASGRQTNGEQSVMPSTSTIRSTYAMSNSLMNATKSSSAKMVPKISKESPKPAKKNSKKVKSPKKQEERKPDIPVMERSGTFLKDEPTFSDVYKL